MMSCAILDRVLLCDVSLLLREKVKFFFFFVNTLFDIISVSGGVCIVILSCFHCGYIVGPVISDLTNNIMLCYVMLCHVLLRYVLCCCCCVVVVVVVVVSFLLLLLCVVVVAAVIDVLLL